MGGQSHDQPSEETSTASLGRDCPPRCLSRPLQIPSTMRASTPVSSSTSAGTSSSLFSSHSS